TRIGQNEKAIGLKADESYVDTVESSLNTKIGNVEVKADGVITEVSEVRADLDGLEYENRNLILNSRELTEEGGNSADVSRRINEDGHLEIIVEQGENVSYASGLGMSSSDTHIESFLNDGD